MNDDLAREERIQKADQEWVAEMRLTADEKARIVRMAFLRAKTGSIDPIKNAIGVFMIGEHLGWKVLLLMHNQKTIQRYEEILDVKFKDIFPEVGPGAKRSVAWNIWCRIESFQAFWRVVRGEVVGVKTAEIESIT